MKTTQTINKAFEQATFPVLGLSCASCAASVQSMLSSQAGVSAAAVNYANATATVDFDPAVIGEQELQSAVRSIGYDLVLEKQQAAQVIEKSEHDRIKKLKIHTAGAALLSIPLMLISMWGMTLPYAGLIMWILATPVVFVFGGRFFLSAYRQLLHKKTGMDTLVALSTGVAYLYSLSVFIFPDFWASKGLPGHLYFESAAVVITFILLGKLLETQAMGRTSADIKKLMGTQPSTATRIKNGQPEEVAVNAIQAGDHLLVKPGEAIPVDGNILSGMPLINESMITGEPVAVQKEKDAIVYAGTLNENTPFQMTATQVGSDTVLASIIKMVKNAQGSKAPIQQLVDKIAARFVLGIIIIAAITFLTWWWLGGTAQISRAVVAVVTVLVIACPCALGLATPAAIMVGIGRGAAMGILIKDAAHLQTLAGVTDIVLDKTGTLTTGKPVVQDAVWLDFSAEHAHALMAMERSSQHPLAEAVADYAALLLQNENKLNNQTDRLTHATFLPGLGLEATVNGTRYYVGNARLLKAKGIDGDARSLSAFLNDHTGHTIVYLAESGDRKVLAVLALTDALKPEAKTTLDKLRDRGITIHMLTGDNAATAGDVAAQTGITSYQANLLPAGKLAYIEQLQQEGKIVAMIGDGINDSAALAQADISMAMSKGSAVAMDVAGMTLIGDKLEKIADGIQLSRLTNKTIKANLFWAFFYNITSIPIAAGILYPFTGFMLSPMIAGAAMAMSSICVLAASLLLRYRKLQ